MDESVDRLRAAREPLAPLPDGARLALHVIVNVEWWDIGLPMPRTALPPPPNGGTVPDVPNFAWYSYGMRVGMRRLFDILAKHGIRATLSLGSAVCASHPEIVSRALDAGWEMMAHGVVQRTQAVVRDEAETIAQSLAQIEAFSGVRPRGWLGPALVETAGTADLLADAGIDYCCDWGPADDVPFDLRVARGRLIAVPYPVDTNDIVMFAVEKHAARELYDRTIAQFATLYDEAERSPKVCALALHPYLTGAPHRIAQLDRLLGEIMHQHDVLPMTGGELADWYAAAVPLESIVSA